MHDLNLRAADFDHLVRLISKMLDPNCIDRLCRSCNYLLRCAAVVQRSARAGCIPVAAPYFFAVRWSRKLLLPSFTMYREISACNHVTPRLRPYRRPYRRRRNLFASFEQENDRLDPHEDHKFILRDSTQYTNDILSLTFYLSNWEACIYNCIRTHD